MTRIMTALLFFLTAVCSFTFAEINIVEPKGVYAAINVKSSNEAINTLKAGTDEEKAMVAAVIESNADQYCPAVFFALATYLFDIGKTDNALFWLYAGRIRTQYDIKRCTDETVAAGYEQLNASVPDLLKLVQFENIENTKKIVERAIEWDKKTLLNYDARWIALHGMGGFLNVIDDKSKKEAALTIPEKEWKYLADKNRKEYWNTFQEDLNSITPQQIEQIKVRIKDLSKSKNGAHATVPPLPAKQ